MLTVPEAARLVGRDPETVRRWIRSGRLRATRVGTQHLIDEDELYAAATEPGSLEVPAGWRRFDSGRPQPDWVRALHESRRGR
jgi:excisionase family DNA binding protein